MIVIHSGLACEVGDSYEILMKMQHKPQHQSNAKQTPPCSFFLIVHEIRTH